MTVHLVNPSHLSFGVGVITPRWLFVLAGATVTGLATDRARVSRANRWARVIAKPCRRLFVARPLPALATTASDV